ncbi:hypothetical protein [Nonomuraea sp. NPDC001699]
MPRQLWCRLTRLLIKRGTVMHPCAARLARFAAADVDVVDKRGVIADITAFLDKYAGRHLVSKRVGWNDLDRLLQAGWIRQVSAAAPGRKAVYRLALDLAALPDDLPKTLADEVRRWIDNPITAAKGGQTKAAVDAGLEKAETVRYGSAVRRGVAREAIMTALACGRLHTSPYTREGLTPPSSHPSQRSRPPRRRPRLWGQDRIEEQGAALNFVKGLAPDWAQQRGGEVPTDAELAELAHLVMLLLRYLPESEARELLTAQVSSARNLCGLLRWRIGKELRRQRRAARRVAALVVDDDGRRHQAWLEANDAANAAKAARRAELVGMARELAGRFGTARLGAEQDRLDARTPTPNAMRPSQGLMAVQSLPQGLDPSATAFASSGPLRAATEPSEIFRREVLDRHRLPTQTDPDISQEHGQERGQDGLDPVAATQAAADRAWLVEMMRGRTA